MGQADRLVHVALVLVLANLREIAIVIAPEAAKQAVVAADTPAHGAQAAFDIHARDFLQRRDDRRVGEHACRAGPFGIPDGGDGHDRGAGRRCPGKMARRLEGDREP